MTARGRRIVVLLAALVGIAATAELGLWQLRRANEKLALQAALDSRGSLPALSAGQLAATPELADSQHYRHVRVRGQWVAHDTVFLDNRQMEGRPGFFVVTPLKLTGRSDAVLVQRGWAPRNANDRAAVPDVESQAGEVEVEGVIAPPPGRLLDFGSAGTGALRQNLPLDAYSREVGLTLLPLSVLQSESPVSKGDGLLRKWPLPAVDIDRHYGYMVQWFGLCALIAGLYAWFQLIKPAVLKSRAKSNSIAIANANLEAQPESRIAEPRPHDA